MKQINLTPKKANHKSKKLRDLPAEFYDIIDLENVTFPEVDNV